METPLRALVLEDRVTDAELVMRELRRSGFVGTWPCVQTEPDFLRQLAESPEIILADYEMPQFSAVRALELLQERACDIPLIIVSGTIGEEIAVDAMRRGAVDYLLKDRLGRLGLSVRTALQMKAERDERARMGAALRESEGRFRQMADHIPEVFRLSDPDTRSLLYVSPAYEQIWGRSCLSLYQAPDSYREAIHPADLAAVEDEMERHRQDGLFDFVYRIVRPDGCVRWIRDRTFPIYGEQGRIQRLAGVARDITEQRELESRLLQSQKMEAMGRLAGGVAHDFNNILTVINGCGELVARSLSPQDPCRPEMEDICKAGRRAAELTHQLLAFSRKQVMDVRVLDLNEAVREVEPILRRLMGDKVELTVMLSSTPACLRADPAQIGQVIMNLAVNASDAMPHGGQLVVEVGTTNADGVDPKAVPSKDRPAEFVTLAMRDSGTGMSEEVQAHLFEPFFTTKPPGKGTGLGLATSFGIVHQSGGSMTVSSREGEGSTFRVLLPRVPAAPSEKVPAVVSGSPRGTETILLVDDERAVLTLSAQILRAHGYTVLEGASGEEGLRLAREQEGRFELLLTDIILANLDGKELAERIHQQWPHVRTLFCSGYARDAMVIDEGRYPDIAFLAKPFTNSELAHKVREVLDR